MVTECALVASALAPTLSGPLFFAITGSCVEPHFESVDPNGEIEGADGAKAGAIRAGAVEGAVDEPGE
jgi:hypothetical protein